MSALDNPFYIVDVFAEAKLEGNQLAIVVARTMDYLTEMSMGGLRARSVLNQWTSK